MVKNGKNRDSGKAEKLDLCMDSKNAQKQVWLKSIKLGFFRNRKNRYFPGIHKIDKFGI